MRSEDAQKQLARTFLKPSARGSRQFVNLYFCSVEQKLGDAGPKTTTNWSVSTLRV